MTPRISKAIFAQFSRLCRTHTPLHRKPFSDALEVAVCNLATQFGCKGCIDFRTAPLKNTQKNNYIDVAWWKKGSLEYLFELDSAARARSVKKLVAQKGAKHRVWVFYGTNVTKVSQLLKQLDPTKSVSPLILPTPKWSGRGQSNFNHSRQWYQLRCWARKRPNQAMQTCG